jgi:rhamnosyltransferase
MNHVSRVLQTESANIACESKVWAVVVTHDPKPDFEQNVRALIPQVKRVIIVDNQSSPAIQQFIARVASAYNSEIIWSQQNLGIASALNTGVELALAGDACQWILMLDQDSRVPPDFVANMFNAYESCSFKDKVALIGANYQLAFRPLRTTGPGEDALIFREVKTLMTSGTLAKRSVFADCGTFDESFFMDYVDHEFCFRVRCHGLRIIQANNAILQHRLGSPTLHRILGRHFVTANYSSNRRYHQARNRLVFYRRYFCTDPFWVVSDVFKWFREILKMIMVERDRKMKLACIARGVWDGVSVSKWSDWQNDANAPPPGSAAARKNQ